MGLLKYLCKKFKCQSSCMYDGNDELFNKNSMNRNLSNYELKIKDVKKIMKILNKRELVKIESVKTII